MILFMESKKLIPGRGAANNCRSKGRIARTIKQGQRRATARPSAPCISDIFSTLHCRNADFQVRSGWKRPGTLEPANPVTNPSRCGL